MESPESTGRVNRMNPVNLLYYLKNHLIDYLFLLLSGAAIIGLDQWTKALVRAKIPLGTDWLPNGLTWL